MIRGIAAVAAMVVLVAFIVMMMRSQDAKNERCYMDRLIDGKAELCRCPGESPSKCMDCKYYRQNYYAVAKEERTQDEMCAKVSGCKEQNCRVDCGLHTGA